METYIGQLVEDMEAAQRPEQEHNWSDEPWSLERHFAEIERWIAGEEPDHTFSYYCEMNIEQFPPAEQLTDQQLQRVCNAFQQLLASWNLEISIPEAVPLRIAYPFIVGVLTEKVQIVTDGLIGIEVCTANPASCPFAAYCICATDFSEEQETIIF